VLPSLVIIRVLCYDDARKGKTKMNVIRRLSRNKKTVIIAVLLGFILLAGLELTNVTYLLHKPKPAPVSTVPNMYTGSNKLPTQASSTDKQDPDTSNSASTPGDTKETKTEINLSAPNGSFVSNHKPNLSGSPSPNQEESICITSPGTQCKISFTKDGIVKMLPVKNTDASGTAQWTWTLQELGLTEGSWQIEATAQYGSQTKTTKDSLVLEIMP
jgi:hypothetical protein